MLLAVILLLLLVAAGLLFVVKPWWFPAAVSAHAAAFDRHFALVLAACAAAFLLAQLALAFLWIRYRDDGRQASASRGDHRLEWIWTGVTAALFLGLALAGAGVWADVHFSRPVDGALRVEVSAKQFAWSFRYPGPDGAFGRTSVKLVNDADGNPFGLDERDPAGKDDIVTSALRVPVGQPVMLTLRARDVIHSFFVRELRLKQDLVPGMDTFLHFQADRPGEYEIPCAELCGLGHHQMRSLLHVLPRPEFDRWMQQALRQAR